jgi:hypothetical protein
MVSQTFLPALFVAIQADTASAFMAVPGITPTIIGAATVALQDAYSYSFKFVYYCMLASGLVAFACSFILLPNVDADQTSLVAKKLAGIESEEVMAEGKDIEDVQVEHTGEK